MNRLLQRLFARLMEEETGGTGSAGGSGDPAPATGDPAAAAAPAVVEPTDGEKAAAAEKATADKVAADKAAAEAKAAEVPEKYEFKFADGVEVEADTLGQFEGIAKELKLSNADAQKVADLAPKFAEKVIAKQAEAWAKQVGDWGKEAAADKTIDPEASKAAMAAFGTPELKQWLDDTGMGNHPELARAFSKIGKAMSDDTLHRGGQGGGKRDAADVMFGATTPMK